MIGDGIDKVNKMSRIKRLFYFLIPIVVLIILMIFLIFIKNGKDKKINNNIISESNKNESSDFVCQNCSYSLINGKEVSEGENNSPFLLATVIDNHPDARPAFGLSQADLVYDIPAEGGINRYLAFFVVDGKSNLEIGPIRSARPYFLDIAKEYGAMLVHCGGSPEALAKIAKDKLLNFNEFYNGDYFRRYSKYLAPHNVLANFDLIKTYLKDRNYEKSVFDSWKFKQGKDEREINLADMDFEINVSNGQNQYAIKWDYDLNSNLYFKNLAGKKHLDSNGEQISASNLILHFVETQILDKELRLKIELMGKNKAIVCLDGLCQDAYWQKQNENDRTKYYYENGEEVVFEAGKTWIHFIDENTRVDY